MIAKMITIMNCQYCDASDVLCKVHLSVCSLPFPEHYLCLLVSA